MSVLVSGGDKYSWMTIFFENLGSVEEKRASGETMAAAVRSSQRSKPHHLALDRFVTHRFVTRRFVAHTFVAHRFVAQSCFKVE